LYQPKTIRVYIYFSSTERMTGHFLTVLYIVFVQRRRRGAFFTRLRAAFFLHDTYVFYESIGKKHRLTGDIFQMH